MERGSPSFVKLILNSFTVQGNEEFLLGYGTAVLRCLPLLRYDAAWLI